jgi:iron complex outermembrane receptor protein
VTEHWKVLAGVRYDHSDVIFDRSFQPTFGPTKSDEKFDVGTPRVGLIYEPLPEKLSFYAMHAESFDPPDGGPYLEVTPLKPEFGQTWEGGVKMKLTEGLNITAAGFYIAKENVSVYSADGFHLEQIGGQTSQGVELSAVGKLTDRWSLLANYAYTDTQVSDPTAGSVIDGQRALGVPYNSASVWSRYNLIDNEHRTLGVGLGLVYVGDRSGDYYSPLVLPSYTRCDAGVYYHRGRFDTSLFVENLFDTVYYTSSINQYEVFPGAPVNVKGQVTYRF